ncbi:acyl-CoA thioesterase [Marinovum sp.]|uniref:acyl-CoA thioesterase n=1 Tax=Marinovum sp. TaxID=2024839 RepID=UPI002B268D64|nr:thioesterase family protein [Marinovum sp.]
MPDTALPVWAGGISWRGTVAPADTDENGHMNVGAYDRMLDATDTAFFLDLGWTPDYPRLDLRGFFRVEKHLRYLSELFEGTPLLGTARILRTDLKKFHLCFQLWNADTGIRSAMMETMVLHMDLEARRAAAMTPGTFARRVTAQAEADSRTPAPPDLGHAIRFDPA